MSDIGKDTLRTRHQQTVANNVRRDAALAIASVQTLTHEEVATVLAMVGLDEPVECLKCGRTQYVWKLCATCDGCNDCCAEQVAS